MKLQEKQKFITRQELARMMGISRNTLYNRLKSEQIDLKPGLISPEDQKRILDLLGIKKSKKNKK